MKTTEIEIKAKPYTVTYNIEEKENIKYFTVTDIPQDLGLGDKFTFDLWESNNIISVPALQDQNADKNKSLIVSAILKAENIDFV